MKAILEYNVMDNDTLKGKAVYYPKNSGKINSKRIAISNLEGYKEQSVKGHSLWEKYDYYINNVIDNYNIDVSILKKLDTIKKEYDEMKEARSFYTGEDFDAIITSINNIYDELIKFLQEKTNTKFGRDFNLQ